VRKSAAKALGMLGAREAVRALIEALNDTSYRVRKSAVRGLGQIGGREALQALQRAVSDPDAIVANIAKEALEKLKRR